MLASLHSRHYGLGPLATPAARLVVALSQRQNGKGRKAGGMLRMRAGLRHGQRRGGATERRGALDHRGRSRLAAAALLLGLVALLFPAGALAEGGKSIAGAPPVTYGQQEFGNTAEGQNLHLGLNGCSWNSYWNLSVIAGDLITINWEASPETNLNLMPIGTTDYDVFQTHSALSQGLSENGKNQARYEVPQTGVMPLYFTDCYGTPGGPYNFTVTAQHALVGRLTSPTTILPNSVISASSNLANGAPAPDGLVFTLSVTWEGGSASYQAATAGGGLSFPLALPESAQGQTVTLVLTRAADAQYREIKSGELHVQVARLQAAPAPVVKPPHHHRIGPKRCHHGLKKVRRHGRAICIRAPHRHHRHRH